MKLNSLLENYYNPDVLECLANLSNDEVFTPPKIANKMIDLLPQELFSDPNTKFLDPACKSGIFLREIAKRLIRGLEDEIPDLQERLDHIYHNQLYGIGITELTSLLSRRTLYYTKYPQSMFSISQFDNPEGNILFHSVKHTWNKKKCEFCGAPKEKYDREEGLESYAYEFIHTYKPEEIFNMKFDVIISNPPYHLNDGGGTGSSAIPIYQHFIKQSLRLNPKYLIMIVPSRWFTGGRGLDDFRKKMLSSNFIKEIHDFPDSSDIFPGVVVKGGVNYFLIDKDYEGDPTIYNYVDGNMVSSTKRPLLEYNTDIFIRDNRKLEILRKVFSKSECFFWDIVSANDPFGFDKRQKNSLKRVKPKYKLKPFTGSIKFYYKDWKKNGLGYVDEKQVGKGFEFIDSYKILIPKAWGDGKENGSTLKPLLIEPGSCCTETYLMIGPFEDERTMLNVESYIRTKFFHFMVYIVKDTQNTMRKCYQFVPMQDFSKSWTDEELYEKYNLTQEEIDFIESMIRPMSDEEE